MAQDMTKVIGRLNDLVALDIDAVNAYEVAINKMSAPSVKTQLKQFQQDHERHIRDLSGSISKMGGTPRTKPDVKGFLIKGFTAVTSAMGDEAALKAMQGNETLTTTTYRKALDESWTEDVRAIIQRNYEDEQRHLTFIQEALRNRSWEQSPTVRS